MYFFFTFTSCRLLDGRQAPIFENSPIRHIFLKFYFFKYKNEKKARTLWTFTRMGPARVLSEIPHPPNCPPARLTAWTASGTPPPVDTSDARPLSPRRPAPRVR